MLRYRLTELIADKQFREGRLVTLAEVSEQAGVNRRTVSAIANNRRDVNPTADVLSRLCAYFNCELGQLAEYVPDSALEEQQGK